MWKRNSSPLRRRAAPGRFAAAGIRDLRELRAGELFHVHEKDMVAGELAHGRGLYLAGIGLGVFCQFSETLERALFTDDQNIRIEYEAAKRISCSVL